MRAADADVTAFEHADVRFHLALAAASGNEALHLVMLAVRDSVAAHLLEALTALADPRPTLARLTEEHAAILAAIEDRRPAEAGEIMRDHVLGFYEEARR
jgi:DNA-binding FadR family transcriptional regulator